MGGFLGHFPRKKFLLSAPLASSKISDETIIVTKKERGPQSKPQKQLWRASRAAERALEVGERASKVAKRASEAARINLEATGRVSVPAKRALEPSGRAEGGLKKKCLPVCSGSLGY